MRNLILLLVLLAGATSGYFIGTFRGKAAIDAPEKAKQAALQDRGKTLKELQASQASNLKVIDRMKLANRNLQSSVKCLSTPVPDDIVRQLQGVQS